MVIPKPLCQCSVCVEARRKGPPYERTGPAAFIRDTNLLIDTPAEISRQLNRAAIETIDYVMFTHLDPDHIEGFRVVEQIANDFRSWQAYPEKRINLVLPRILMERLQQVKTAYGSQAAFYETQGYIECTAFDDKIQLNGLKITALPVERGDQTAFIYVFEKASRKVVYAPCDIKPFPEDKTEVYQADLVVIQPGIFETGLKHRFYYPGDHISRKTLYTFEETIALCQRIKAKQILFVHLEEYWNRSYTDYRALEQTFDAIRFAYDGMALRV